MTIKKKPDFGELTSNEFNIGDIVEWSIWNAGENEWNWVKVMHKTTIICAEWKEKHTKWEIYALEIGKTA
jgi:hypothetical protein